MHGTHTHACMHHRTIHDPSQPSFDVTCTRTEDTRTEALGLGIRTWTRSLALERCGLYTSARARTPEAESGWGTANRLDRTSASNK